MCEMTVKVYTLDKTYDIQFKINTRHSFNFQNKQLLAVRYVIVFLIDLFWGSLTTRLFYHPETLRLNQ